MKSQGRETDCRAGSDFDPQHPLVAALRRIAKGRGDCGRPLAAEKARQAAREALVDAGIGWAKPMFHVESQSDQPTSEV